MEKNEAGSDLLHHLEHDYYRFVGNIIVINGAPEQRYIEEPILHTINPESFVNIWLSIDRTQETKLINCFSERYHFHPEFFEHEEEWFNKVCTQLEKRIKAEPIKPRKVQIKLLLKNLQDEVLKPQMEKKASSE